MKQKLYFTSAIAMVFVVPAIAEPTYTGEFPSGGLMQADYTYTNAATSTNMAGVYEGTVNAEAQYEDVLYQLAEGEYLPANSETPITCNQNGYFCPGDSNGVYYQSYVQGLTQCPNGYTNSGNGASANTDCFRTCLNTDVDHSTGAVNGAVYYNGTNGDGVSTCAPTACLNGYHIKSATPNLMSIIGVTNAATNIGYVTLDGKEESNAATYGLSTTNDFGKFVVDFGNSGKITGLSQCSTRSGDTNTWANSTYNTIEGNVTNTLPDNTGGYCYCKLDGYISNTGVLQSFVAPWLFIFDYSSTSDSCISRCAYRCASYLQRNDVSRVLAFREALFDTVIPSTAMCKANTITINWTGTTDTEINANNAGTATYGSDIRTPRSATPVPGKTFTGWRFVAPEQASVSEP